jgi:hypothetical protein
MTCWSVSRKVRRAAWRGDGNELTTCVANFRASEPEIRTTPTAPGPGAVATATIVGAVGSTDTPRERAFYARLSSLRVIVHCWVIERQLFTNQ